MNESKIFKTLSLEYLLLYVKTPLALWLWKPLFLQYYFLWLGHTIIIIQKKRAIYKADRSLQVFTGQKAEFHKTSIQKGQQGKQTKSPVLAIMLLILGAFLLRW